jgi:hypothetical protein
MALSEGASFDTWTKLLGLRATLKDSPPKSKMKAFWATETGRTYRSNLNKDLTRFLLSQDTNP